MGLFQFSGPLLLTAHYRVTAKDTRPSGVLSGIGSYYTLGGRYHRPHQRTVYASDDALVAITEMAYYQALEWRDRIGGGRTTTPVPMLRPSPPIFPLASSHALWCFTLAAPTTVIDLDDPIAFATLQHAPIEILNPGQAYETTQSLADRIRTFTDPHRRRPGGSRRLPSARRPRAATSPPSTPCS